jgi:hypothetical protein
MLDILLVCESWVTKQKKPECKATFFFKYCFLEKGGRHIFEALRINFKKTVPWFISLETGETSDLTDRQLIDCV